MKRKNRTSEKDRPETWTKYKKKLCESCQATCCTMPVEVGVIDLIRLGLIEEAEAAFSLEQVAKKLKKARWIKSYQPKTQMFTLAQVRGSDCIFLDQNRRCTVYEKRPNVCRRFPTSVGSRVGYCPYTPLPSSR